jgi:hypothetical protein
MNTTSPAEVDKLISRKQAAQLLGVKPHTLAMWALTKRYQLKAVKYGNRTRGYMMSDVLKFRDDHRN